MNMLFNTWLHHYAALILYSSDDSINNSSMNTMIRNSCYCWCWKTAPETHSCNYIKLSCDPVDVWLWECSEYYVVNPTFGALVVCFAQDLRLVFAGTNGEDMRANQTRWDPVSHETPSVNYTSADITLISSIPHSHSSALEMNIQTRCIMPLKWQSTKTSLTPLHVVINTWLSFSQRKERNSVKDALLSLLYNRCCWPLKMTKNIIKVSVLHTSCALYFKSSEVI